MALTPEWRNRIECWRRELPAHLYRPLAPVETTGFVTTEQLAPEETLEREFRPMPPGTPWGAKWENGWIRGEVV